MFLKYKHSTFAWDLSLQLTVNLADYLNPTYERLHVSNTLISFFWIPDSLKLWDNKCLLF